MLPPGTPRHGCQPEILFSAAGNQQGKQFFGPGIKRSSNMGVIFDAHSDILNDIHPRRILGEKRILENYWIPKIMEDVYSLKFSNLLVSISVAYDS